MDFTLVKLNDGFMIGKLNTSRPSLKMTIPQPLLTTSKSLDIIGGITLTFWRGTKQTTITKSKRPFLFIKLEPAFKVNFGSEEVMLY